MKSHVHSYRQFHRANNHQIRGQGQWNWSLPSFVSENNLKV